MSWAKLDRWLIETIFEPAVCEVESWTGYGKYSLLRFLHVLTVAGCGAVLLASGESHDRVIFGMVLGFESIAFWHTYEEEKKTRRGFTASWNKHSLFCSVIRGVGLFAVISSTLMGSQLVIWLWAGTATAYVDSCDQLPPKERLAWLSKTLEA